LISALFINVGNASSQTAITLQSSGTITQGSSATSTGSAPLTVILRGICITDLNPNQMNISAWVDSYVANHSYANAVTISDMHQYGIWWYGYSFSQTKGTWMGWTFQQLETLIDRFHYDGWKVGLETTEIAWEGQQEYNYIETLHPELAFTNANGVSAAVTDNNTNYIIPDPFAVFATPDPVNNITAGTRLIDLYTTRLTQMIKDGLSWDFWFGTDGWNGLNLEGYSWDSSNPAACYSFSQEEINEWATSQGITSSSMVTIYNVLGVASPIPAYVNAEVSGTKYAAVFQCTATGTLTALNTFTYSPNGANVKLAIYSGTSTTPESLLGQTNSVSVPASNTAKWYSSNLTSSVAVTAGQDYWLSVEGSATIGLYYSGVTETMVDNSNTFGAFSNPFGTATSSSTSVTIDAAYNNQTRSWGSISTTQQASLIINQYLNPWNEYWQGRFAQEYAQIKQAFINAGESPNTFHVIGSADTSSVPDGGGNLSPAGMYNMTDMAQYNSLDYIYCDQEGASWGLGTYDLGPLQAFVGATIKMQNPSLNPIIGLQPVNWLETPYPLWEVEQEYLSQAVNYVWYNGIRYQVSVPNVIMMQYPNTTGWAGWSASDMNSLFSFINSTIASLQNANPVWLGPTYTIPDGYVGPNFAFTYMNYSIAQWTWADNYAYNTYNSEMGTVLSGATLPWSGTTESIDNQMYSANNCPVVSSKSLIDLKIFQAANSNIIIPMTDQYDVGDSFTIPSSISTTLTINTTALGLTQPAQDYSVYWESAPNTLMPLSSSGSVTVTLNGGADVLVISPN
jgi:hypothetical protein